MALSFDATYYLSTRPDVFNYYISVGAEAATGMDWAQFAEQHYNTYGWKEGANPNAIFDTSDYLTANIDVAEAGVNPFTHYLQFGANEGRAPSATFLSFADFEANYSAAYLAANPDLGAAGIDTPELAYGHFVVFGQFEGREGAPVIDHGIPGDTFTLTTAVDNVVGTANDDTVVGVIDAATLGTFTTGDSINGGAGNDTLKIIAAAAGTITPASITNVETIEVQALAASTINLSNATGVQTLATVNSTANTTFTNVGAAAAISVSNSTGGTVNVGYTAALVAGLADAQNVSLNNATSTVNVAGIETFNIEATGANTLALTNDGNTINVSGAGSLALGTVGVTTLNASANAGGVTATLAAGDVAVTGGSGDDTFGFGEFLTTADVVDGGEGFDTASVDLLGTTVAPSALNENISDISSATAAAAFNALTNVERVEFTGGQGVTLNGATFTNAGITNLLFNTSGGINPFALGNDTINNAGSARTYEFGTANAGSATFNMNGTSTELNLSLLGTEGGIAADDGVDANVGALNVNLSGVAAPGTLATINIDSQGDLADAVFNNVGIITAVAGSTINITGAGNLDIAGLAARGVIDASAATGNLVIEGSNINTAATTAVGGDIITLGAGQDTVQFTTAAASGLVNATPSLGLQVDVINGFTAGVNGDVLDFNPAGGDADYTALVATAQAAINALSGVGATLKAAADIAAAALVTADEWTAFTFQGQTYAQYDGDGNGAYDEAADLLVQITGVAVADLTAANFA